MTLQRDANEAPHLGRTILIAPNRRVNLAGAGHPLATINPTTQLGAVALNLAMQTSSATIQIIATAAYVNALTALSPPHLTFSAPPPNTQGITVQQLQEAYDSFVQQLALLQGEADAWIMNSAGGSGGGIFSSLVSVPRYLTNIDAFVQGNFTILTETPKPSDWDSTLKQQIAQIGAYAPAITNLGTQLTQLSTNLNAAAKALVSAAGKGVLAQLQTAYQDEINALNQEISNANSTISSDDSSIAWLGVATGASIVVGIIGLLNFWNPVGWLEIAGGVVGAYFAIGEIETLKGDIAVQKAKIQADTDMVNTDQTAAQMIASFAQSAQAAATMNSAAQQELNTLIQLCETLGADLSAAVADLNSKEIDAAVEEWNAVIAAADFLSNINAYLWPSSIQLANPTSLSAAGSNAYLVSNSGTVYQYTTGGNTWTALPDYSLSAVAAGTSQMLYAIDGAPAGGTQIPPTTYGQSFNVKVYPLSTNTWQTIGAFKAAQIATDGSGVWAVKQDVTDRQAYQFTSGTSWTPVGAMPNSDAPGDIAAYDGILFAIANNGGGLWYAGSSGWTRIGSFTYTRLSANGAWLGLVDPDGAAWVVSLATAGSYTPVFMGSSISLLAQAPNGDQYITDNNLNLWHIVYTPGGAPSSTLLRGKIVAVAVSDGGTVYATDNNGEIWTLTNPSSNSWQQLPALPTS